MFQLSFTARNRCGAYNPVTPDISFWLVRTKTTVLKIVTLLAKSAPDLFKLTWIVHRIITRQIRRGHKQLFHGDQRHFGFQLPGFIVCNDPMNLDLEMQPSASSDASKYADCIYMQLPHIRKVDELGTRRHHGNEFCIEPA